jgi:hypothetical protein
MENSLVISYLIILITIGGLSCRVVSFDKYPEISFEEVVELKKSGNDFDVILVDSNNKLLKANEIEDINLEYYHSEFRRASKDSIFRKVIKATTSIDERMLQVIFQNIEYVPEYKLHNKSNEIDCSDLKPLIDSLYASDQYIRKSKNINRDLWRKTDSENVKLMEAVIEKCGFKEEFVKEMWLLVQHSPFELQLRYYEELNNLYKKGILSGHRIALIRDRMLLRSGFHQEYGSQGNEEVNLKIYNYSKVDSIRKTMDMIPLEEYLDILYK